MRRIHDRVGESQFVLTTRLLPDDGRWWVSHRTGYLARPAAACERSLPTGILIGRLRLESAATVDALLKHRRRGGSLGATVAP